MSADPLSIALPAVGVFQDDGVVVFSTQAWSSGVSFIHTATNLHISERRFQTRSRWKELTLEIAPEGWATANTQGLIAYDPRIGKTRENTTTGDPGLIESAAGKLYRITPDNHTFTVEDISNAVEGKASMRLAWMAQGANYVVRTDGVSPTQIWNGVTTTTSTGYNKDAPASSRLPNFAGPIVYTDRFWVVNNGNEIIAGDHIHRINLVGNDDILKTTDQSYDITSVSFPAPVEMGDILSLHNVTSVRGGDLAAQGEIVAGTQGPGMWGVLSGTTRDKWAQTAMRRVIHPSVGPTGPYAAWSANDELVMRTFEGVTSIKYAGQESSQVGNPHVNIGNEIKPLLDKDPSDLLLFASMVVSSRRQRLACTVWPVTDGAARWHRGYVTAALAPGRTRTPEPMVWEGVSTIPTAMGEVVQFCEVRTLGATRLLAITRKEDGTKGLAEWTNAWGDDILADGTAVPIPWQILTRRLTVGGEYSVSSWGSVYLSLLNIRDKVDVVISARDRMDAEFKVVYTGTITNPRWGVDGGYADAELISLGTRFKEFKKPWIQILVQGTGSCIVDLAIGGTASGSPTEQSSGKEVCVQPETICQFDPFKRA